MSFIDDFAHTVDRACDKVFVPLAKKLSGKVDGSDADPTGPQDGADAPITTDTIDSLADQIASEHSDELKAAIKQRITERMAADPQLAQHVPAQT